MAHPEGGRRPTEGSRSGISDFVLYRRLRMTRFFCYSLFCKRLYVFVTSYS